MPETDIGRDLVADMVRQMAYIVKSNELLIKSNELLAKSNDLLAQKVEDVTAALDDTRERLDSQADISDELTGYLGAILKISEDVAEAGVKEGGQVGFADLRAIFRNLKREAEVADEEEEEDEEPVER